MPEPSLEPSDKGLEGSLSDSVGEERTARGGEANRECLTLNPRADMNWENGVHYRGEETRLLPQKTDERMAVPQPLSLVWNKGQSTFTKGRPEPGLPHSASVARAQGLVDGSN